MTQRQALVIRHIDFEGLGNLAPALHEAGYDIEYHEAAKGGLERIEPEKPDLLVVLGGPIGVADRQSYPIIGQQIDLLRQRLIADLPTLGICLGAQFMAAALGSQVYPGPEKEIGWSPLTLSPAGLSSPLRHLADIAVLHWHGDTFDLPPECDRLASTPLCSNQAFARGSRILGLQCHPEFQENTIESWLIGHASELASAGIDPRDLRQQTRANETALQTATAPFWREWLAKLD